MAEVSAQPDSVVLQIAPEGSNGSRSGSTSWTEDEDWQQEQSPRAMQCGKAPATWEAFPPATAPPRAAAAAVAPCNGQPHGDPDLDSAKLLEFEVVIERDGDELGVDVLQHGLDTLLINRIKVGPVLLWNRCHPDQSVQPGDRIVEVNGARGSSEGLIGRIRGERSLRLGIRRLLEYSVAVRKIGTLGLDIAQHSHSLRVLRVGPGPFQDWNDKCTMDHHVRYGDFLVEVNGLRGMSQELLGAIQASGEQLQVLLVRGTHGRRLPAATAPGARSATWPAWARAARGDDLAGPPPWTLLPHEGGAAGREPRPPGRQPLEADAPPSVCDLSEGRERRSPAPSPRDSLPSDGFYAVDIEED